MIVDKRQISVEKTTQSKLSQVNFNNIVFGKQFSDHMFVVDYKDGEWKDLSIKPYEKLSLSPACAALHYGQAVFEGMKAYKNEQGEIFLFRPEENAKRINVSASRMCMPEIPQDIFLEGLKKLIEIDAGWVPSVKGCSLYIRPFMFASEQILGVRPANEYKFIIFTSPVGAYYSEPVHVKIEKKFTRAAEGGVGYAKAAGNYAAALYPAKIAQEQGYHQLVWTDAKEHKYIEESGTMNIMFHINDKIITPSLDFQTTLAGITRDSVITLLKEWGVTVEERRVTVEEVVKAAKNGSLKDVFGTGTAATIAQVASISEEEVKYNLPDIASRELSNKLDSYLKKLRHGEVEDKHNWLVKL